MTPPDPLVAAVLEHPTAQEEAEQAGFASQVSAGMNPAMQQDPAAAGGGAPAGGGGGEGSESKGTCGCGG